MLNPAVIFLSLFAFMTLVAPCQADALAELQEACDEYESDCASARDELQILLRREEERLQKTGKFAALQKVQSDLVAFADEGRLPETVSTRAYLAKISRSRTRLIAKYESAIRECTMKGNLDVAKETQAKLDAFKAESAKKLAGSRFIPLFNGRDLKGWQPAAKFNGQWTVKNGQLIGAGPTGYLFTDRGNYRNFILRAEVMITGGEDGGVFIRCPHGPPKPGCEVDINSPTRGEKESGTVLLYLPNGEGRVGTLVSKPTHKTQEWFSLDITAKGNRVTVRINGVIVSSYISEDTLPQEGHIALQHYVTGKAISFRKIEILELPNN